jgi:hypothetical protein
MEARVKDHVTAPYVLSDRAATFLSLHPFPWVLDQLGIVSWVSNAILNEILLNRMIGIVVRAGSY